MTVPDDEFKFTDEQWRAYQAIPDQGYSHRGWLEYQVNQWLAEHRRQGPITDAQVERELETAHLAGEWAFISGRFPETAALRRAAMRSKLEAERDA